MDTVPFKVDDPDAMLTVTEGVMQVYEDGLLLQIETRDAIIGHFNGNARLRQKVLPYCCM